MHKCKCISVKWMYEMHKSHGQTALDIYGVLIRFHQ